MDPALIVEWLVKSILLVLVMTGGFAYVTLLERKVLARMQVRIGPNRAGPQGLLQPVADAVKLMLKEDLIPAGADQVLFWLAPCISFFTAATAFSVFPFSATLHVMDVKIIQGPTQDKKAAPSADKKGY